MRNIQGKQLLDYSNGSYLSCEAQKCVANLTELWQATSPLCLHRLRLQCVLVSTQCYMWLDWSETLSAFSFHSFKYMDLLHLSDFLGIGSNNPQVYKLKRVYLSKSSSDVFQRVIRLFGCSPECFLNSPGSHEGLNIRSKSISVIHKTPQKNVIICHVFPKRRLCFIFLYFQQQHLLHITWKKGFIDRAHNLWIQSV